MRRRTAVIFAVAVVLAIAACSNSGGRSAEPAEPAPASSDPAQPAPAGSSAPAALPPIDVACTQDRDCALADLHLTGPETCCQGCNMAYAARVDWIERVRAACAARTDLTARCRPLNCPVAAQRAVCRDARCTVTP